MLTARLLRQAGHDVGLMHPTPLNGRARTTMSGFAAVGDVELEAMRRFLPDAVHIFDVSPRSATSYMQAADKLGVRAVHTMSDYSAFCPTGRCRTPEGVVCEDCLHGRPRVMNHKCVKSATLQSFMALLRMLYWDTRRQQQCAGTFITPSAFMRSKMMEAGFAAARVVALPFPVEKMPAWTTPGDYFCYSGPLTVESGVETLGKAALLCGRHTVIAGSGPLLPRLRELAARSTTLVIIEGERPALLAGARAVVIPSESYLCDDLLLKKALCAGTPVVASDIASLTEMVTDADGVLFDAGNREQLATVMRDFDRRHAFRHDSIGHRARTLYSPQRYVSSLLSVYAGNVMDSAVHRNDTQKVTSELKDASCNSKII